MAFKPYAKAGSRCKCDSCGDICKHEDLRWINDAEDRLDAGSIVPAGECKKCGSLSYLVPVKKKGPQAYVIRQTGTKPPRYRTSRYIEGETTYSDAQYFHTELQYAMTYSTKHALSGRQDFWEMVPVTIVP